MRGTAKSRKRFAPFFFFFSLILPFFHGPQPLLCSFAAVVVVVGSFSTHSLARLILSLHSLDRASSSRCRRSGSLSLSISFFRHRQREREMMMLPLLLIVMMIMMMAAVKREEKEVERRRATRLFSLSFLPLFPWVARGS